MRHIRATESSALLSANAALNRMDTLTTDYANQKVMLIFV